MREPLRIESAAEKNVLVGSNPRHGLATEAEAEAFGNSLAISVRDPRLPTSWRARLERA
jgi:hypothetical protein